VNIRAVAAGRLAGLLIEVDVDANIGLSKLSHRKGEDVAVEDPGGSAELLPDGLAVPDLVDEAALLTTSSDHVLVVVDGLGGSVSDGKGVELDVNSLAEDRGRLTGLEGVTSAAGVNPHSSSKVNVLHIVKDSVDDLSLSSGGWCRVAVSIVAGDILAARVRSTGGLGRALHGEHGDSCVRLVSGWLS
jgi:hypothetical protein